MNHKLTISLKSNDYANLAIGQKKILLLFNLLNNNIEIQPFTPLPKQKSYITVLRSPHIDKKSREQFVYKTSKMNIDFNFSDAASLHSFIFALNQIEVPGVEMKIMTKEWKYYSI